MLIPGCPLCGGTERYYSFLVGDERFDQCRDCGLLSHKAVKGVESPDPTEFGTGNRDQIEPALVTAIMSLLEQYVGTDGRRMGITGRAAKRIAEEARRRGFRATAIVEGERSVDAYDIVLATNLLEDSSVPVALVESLRDLLCEGGTIAIVTRQLVKPGLQTQNRHILEPRQRHSFSDTNLQVVLWKAGFTDVFLGHHVGEEDQIRDQDWFKDQAIAFGRKRERQRMQKLSVILPVFNEARTARQVLEALAIKQMPGIDLEIVVVESASTDGSREIVLQYQNQPRFKIVLEDRPRGKGFAVRNGLRHATGDLILIQDADLEYDLLDYEMLVSPVLSGRTAFVLGTRHAGTWKIRKFGQSGLANLMNLAHWAFAFLLNKLYHQSMTDPFTMFKVFRADCLSGLEFECNRFDFDFELVCKLLRKGYTPLEIPVNYQSRSFKEGKKVRILRDPLTWIRAAFKYRASPVVQMPVARNKATLSQDHVHKMAL